MGTEKKWESWGWIAGAEVKWREHRERMAGDPQIWASVASETFLYISIQMLPPFCSEDFMLSTAYIIMHKIFGGESKTFHELASNSHFHFLSLSARLFTLPYQLPPSMRCPECPFIWIGVPLFEYIDLFQCTITVGMDISRPVIPSLGQPDKKMYGGFMLSRVICGNRCYLAICDCLLDSWSALGRATLLLTASCKKRDQSH